MRSSVGSAQKIRALLFDFDGVLVDSERLHLEMFRCVLAEKGLSLSEEDYFERYLGLDDRGCFEAVYRDRGLEPDPQEWERLIRLKHQYFMEESAKRAPFLPGAQEVISKAAGRFFLAIVSGALRAEVEMALVSGGWKDKFSVIVAAEDVKQGKPHPEGFLKALRVLNRDFVPASEILLANECLVIEDSPWGIEAGLKAGCRVLGLSTSYPAQKLKGAERVIPNLLALRLDEL